MPAPGDFRATTPASPLLGSMMKLIAASAILLAAASGHADNACYTSCYQECIRSGSLARTCQLECTRECPSGGGSTPTCTTVTDSSAHDSCIATATANYALCTAILPEWPFGPAICSQMFLNAVNACPAPVQTTVCR
jgi:hypothetical protein